MVWYHTSHHTRSCCLCFWQLSCPQIHARDNGLSHVKQSHHPIIMLKPTQTHTMHANTLSGIRASDETFGKNALQKHCSCICACFSTCGIHASTNILLSKGDTNMQLTPLSRPDGQSNTCMGRHHCSGDLGSKCWRDFSRWLSNKSKGRIHKLHHG